MADNLAPPTQLSFCEPAQCVDSLFYVQVVRSVEEFAALEHSWQELSADCSQDSAFACWDWAYCWWKHFCQSDLSSHPYPNTKRTLYLLCVRDEKDRLHGIAPFYSWADGKGIALTHELRMFGDEGRDGEGMTDEPILLLRRGYEQKAHNSILNHLLERKKHAPNSFKLRLQNYEPLLPYSSVLVAKGRRIKMRNRWEVVRGDRSEIQWFARRWLLKTKHQQGSELVTLPGSWEAFRKSLSRSMRDNLSYYPRRLEKEGHILSVQIAKTPQEVRAATTILVTLHNHRMQSTRGPKHLSHIPTGQHQCFLTDCLPRMAAQGQAFIGLVTIDGQIVAAQAFLGSASTLTVYYSGFQSDWYDYSPLTILHMEVIKGAILRGVQFINFLPGHEQWKKRWGAVSQGVTEEMVGLQTSPASLAKVTLRSTLRALSRQRLGK